MGEVIFDFLRSSFSLAFLCY